MRRAGNEQILGFVACNKNSTELNPRVSWQFFKNQTSFGRKSRDSGPFTPKSLVDLVVFQRVLLFCTLSNKSNLSEQQISVSACGRCCMKNWRRRRQTMNKKSCSLPIHSNLHFYRSGLGSPSVYWPGANQSLLMRFNE